MSRYDVGSAVLLLAFVSTIAVAGGCKSTPAEVEEAPMGEEGQKKLRNALVGKWRKAEGVPEAAAAAEGSASEQEAPSGGDSSGDGETIVWSFKEDGSGEKTVKSSPDDEGTSRAFQWRLEGRNIVIDFEDGSESVYFRAETWSPAQMQWFHYVSGERRTVKKFGQ